MLKNRQENSDVWKYFTKLTSEPNKAVCKYCSREISRGGKNAKAKGFTTTNMWAHVKRFHQDEMNRIPDTASKESGQSSLDLGPPAKKQATIPQVLSKVYKYSCDDPRAQEITRLIAEEICIDMEPLDHVNKIGFQRLVKKMCPQYEMVSRTHISQTILPDMFSRVKAKVKSELNRIPYLSMTTDLWSSDASSNINDFIGITAHGLDEKFVPHNFCLEVMPFEGDAHTGENIANNLLAVLDEWNIKENVKLIVTDNARNMVTAIAKLPEIDHISCLAHTLQLVLQDAIFVDSEVNDVITIARKIVGHFSHSTKAVKLLQHAQQKYNIVQHVLIQDVPTRWDSTYEMLNRLHEQRIAIQAASLDLKCLYHLPNHQWLLVEEVVKVLAYFSDATKTLSKDRVTLADAIPLINSLFKILERDNDAENQSIKDMTQNLKLHMVKRFNEMEENKNYVLATFLDPRYKGRVYRNQSTIEKAKQMLLSECDSDEQMENENIENRGSASQPSTSGGIWAVCQEIISDMEFEEPLSRFAANGFQHEIENYLKSPNLSHSSDIFKYWNDNATFPRIKKLALKYLSYKPSSVDSERLFSTAGLIQTPKRNRLSPQNLKILCFLNKNLSNINFNY